MSLTFQSEAFQGVRRLLWITTADRRIEQIRTTGKTGILPPRCWQGPVSWEAEAESSRAHEFKASLRNMRLCSTPIKNHISKFLKSYHQEAIEEILCKVLGCGKVLSASGSHASLSHTALLPVYLPYCRRASARSGSQPTWNHTCFLPGAAVSAAATPH